ncbi:AzlC family ABC transporter permease [Streptomyces cupreus]|uniref:AzlC family ABC transporter permease n=1 Tax=Streptomyces cupreus TaxID=2759956 RepID=A0A7X1JAI0_9ACTN|nr:AzlC family ABC transporter permease [Streptomyces cupreus]MBC2907169.1 AzlC family ABC transporter permease [Streptomyces cupreus]
MRSPLRTPMRAPLVRDSALVWLASGVVGVSFGAISVAGGLPVWVPVVMSLVVYAGSAQFSAVGVLPALRENPAVRRCALLGAGLALAVTPAVPAGVPVLVALAGLVGHGHGGRRTA